MLMEPLRFMTIWSALQGGLSSLALAALHGHQAVVAHRAVVPRLECGLLGDA
jgi:hypothetical protein